MAFKFSKIYNKQVFNIDTKDYSFKKLSELDMAKTYKINGLYLNRGKFGIQAVAIVSDEKILVNLPLHLTETVQAILADVEAIETIENGKVGFTLKEYVKNEKNCYSIVFVDL